MRLMLDVDAADLLRAQDLGVGRDGHLLADGLVWRLRPGQWWWVEGANGSGKSTLLATLLGDLPPLAGTLSVHPWVADGSGVAVVPQHDPLPPTLPLTAGEHVRLAGGRPAAAAAVCAELGVDPAASYWTLSGGQRQRARIARALAAAPALILLDEPFNHLDRASVEACCAALARRRDAGLAVVVVGHQVPAVAGSCGRIVIADGRMEAAWTG